jgi:hypothetical protein
VEKAITDMQEKLDIIMKCPAISTYANTSLNPSYVDVARTPPNSIPANLNSISFIRTTPSTIIDTLYYTIDTFRVANEDTDKTSAGVIRITVEKEIQTLKDQTNWRCRAVTKDTKNTTRIRIVCRDENEQ